MHLHKPSLAAAVAASVGMLALSACGDRQQNATTAQSEAPPAVAPAAPAEPAPPPPPSAAVQHEQALQRLGGEITDEGLKVTLASADFPSGSAEFQPESMDRINAVAALLKERDDLRLEIRGYTDDRGTDTTNERLSKERAEAVEQMLVSQAGLEEDRIEAKGLGEADPVASNDTEEGRARNRRVELVIVDKDGGYEPLQELGNGSSAETTASAGTG